MASDDDDDDDDGDDDDEVEVWYPSTGLSTQRLLHAAKVESG